MRVRHKSEKEREKDRAYARDKYKQDPTKHIKAVLVSRQKTYSNPEQHEEYKKRRRIWTAENAKRINHEKKLKLEQMKKYNFFEYKAMRYRYAYKAKITGKELENIWNSQNGKCYFSGRDLKPETAQLDHIIPKSKGGKHAVSNFRWVSPEANYFKGDQTDENFYRFIKEIVLYRNL